MIPRVRGREDREGRKLFCKQENGNDLGDQHQPPWKYSLHTISGFCTSVPPHHYPVLRSLGSRTSEISHPPGRQLAVPSVFQEMVRPVPSPGKSSVWRHCSSSWAMGSWKQDGSELRKLSLPYPPFSPSIHSHIHRHVHTLMDIHTHTHTHMQCTYAVHTCTHLHTYDSCIHVWTCGNTCVCSGMQHGYIHAHTYDLCVHVGAQSYTHAYAIIHTHTHTHTDM